jgi:hypothetical protein
MFPNVQTILGKKLQDDCRTVCLVLQAMNPTLTCILLAHPTLIV